MRSYFGQTLYDQLTEGFLKQSSTYKDSMNLTEWHMYGSSRLGIYQTKVNMAYRSVKVENGVTTQVSTTSISYASYSYFPTERGAKRYELSNHLGNVLVVVSDKKIPICSNNLVTFYKADVVSATDYSAFGAPLSERTYQASEYRFGFNGKEADNEISGIGNSQDYGLRIYDNRIARFKSFDPLAKSFPWNSPYSFAEGSPIENIDLDGAEKYNYRMSMTSQGEIKMTLVSQQTIIDKVIVGYKTVSYGSGAEVPIFETRFNQRQEYNVNGRNASLSAVQELQGTKIPAPIIQAGIDKIKSDYASNGGQFSENYNVTFGRFLFEQGFKGVKQSDFVKSATETWQTVDNATWKNGSTLYHLYESFVRQNDNTGYDKLLHFTASAYYTMSLGPTTSYTLGLSKEFFKDFVPGMVGIGEGWDSNDMNANQDGINYGNTVNNAVENNTDEIQFLD